MSNFIQVNPLVTTQGTVTDITYNVEPVVVATIASSNILNGVNTYPYGQNLYQSTESKAVVFSEIKNYLESNPSTAHYQIINNNRFEW